MKKLFSLILLLSFSIKAQSQIIFDNVKQKQIISQKSYEFEQLFASIFNFGYLSKAKVDELGNYLKVLLKYKNSKEGYNLYDYDGNTPVKPKDLINRLVIKNDSVETERFSEDGSSFFCMTVTPDDSTWFFETLSGFSFTEDWIIDTVKFTCDIKSKSYAPFHSWNFGEQWGPNPLYQITPKPTLEKQTFNFITDFIITDIYIDNNDESYFINGDSSHVEKTNLDPYKTLMLINFIIDKAKLGKIACFNPVIPFNTQLTTAELKSLLTEDVSFNKDDNFQVRNKLYSYSFKMVEKWAFDSKSLAFKKVALGIVLMKIKKKTLGLQGMFKYTFSPVFYIPFNKKIE